MKDDHRTYFLIRPVASNSESSASESQSFVWAQSLDRHMQICEANRDALIEVAKLGFLAYQAGREEQSAPQPNLSVDDFDQRWQIEWIQGTSLASDSIAGTLDDEIVGRISQSASSHQIAQHVSRLAKSKPQKKKRRYLPRVSLRAFLLLVSLAGVLLAFGGRWITKYQRQQSAAEYFTKLGATVEGKESDVPKFIVNLLGDAFATKTIAVTCDAKDAESLSRVSDLVFLERLDLRGGVLDLVSISGLSELKHLELNLCDVADISAIKYLTKLEYVRLGPNVVDISSLSHLSELQILRLSRSGVSDLSALTQLERLEQIYLKDTPVRSLAPLANKPNLTRVHAFGSAVNDASGLASCPMLAEVDLRSTGVTNLDWVRPLNGLVALLLDDSLVSDLGPLKGKSIRGVAIARTPVTDLSPLANCTADTLDVPPGVTDISVVSTFTGLQTLRIKGTKITKLPTLASTSLTNLEIEDSPISDLSGLAGCLSLSDLELKQIDATDLSPLANCPNLSDLKIVEAPVTDLAPLSGLQKLHSLSLNKVPIADLSPLKTMPRLISLRIKDIATDDYAVLQQMSQLEQLKVANLPKNQLQHILSSQVTELSLTDSDVTAISQLPPRVLKTVDLSGSKIQNLSGIEQHRSLNELKITNTQVSDLRPLRNLNLFILEANDTLVTDVSPIMNMGSMYRLDLSGTPLSNLKPFLGFVGQEALSIDLSDTKVVDVSPLAKVAVESLSLARTPVVDASQLPRVIVHLDISGTKVADLSNLEDVYYLDASNTAITKIPDCGTYFLDVSGTQVSDLTGVGPRVFLLDISNTKVTDLTPLYGHRALKDLHIEGLELTESQLQELKRNLVPTCKIHHKEISGYLF